MMKLPVKVLRLESGHADVGKCHQGSRGVGCRWFDHCLALDLRSVNRLEDDTGLAMNLKLRLLSPIGSALLV
jgi:hypothetical protein